MSTNTLLSLGNFRFSISTASYETLTKTHGWNWAEQQVLGADPVLQFTGFDAKQITLRGRIYRTFLEQNYSTTPEKYIDALIEDANLGLPLTLVSSDGTVLGYWVVISLNLTDNFINKNGMPQKIEFDLTIKRYAP